MKPDSSPISSQAMINRMTALIAGEVQPETETDRLWMQEMNEIIAAGGEIAVPTDLPDPMPKAEAAWHLDLSDDAVRSKSAVRRVRFDWYGRDGDLDGDVQDGTPFQRRSRSNSHNAIGRRRRKLIQRLRLRDMPFPFVPEAPPANMPPVAAARPEEKGLLSIGQRMGRRAKRSARFNPDAIDGNSDGTVQDGTVFERPATPRPDRMRTSLRKPIFASGSGKKKAKPSTVATPPFTAWGARNTFRPPRDLGNESRFQQVVGAVKKYDFKTLSEFLGLYGPFGGHRSKQDGAHPAIAGVVADLHKRAEKHGPLDTYEQMEKALQKAYPNAEIGLHSSLELGGDFDRVAASESFRVDPYDHVKKIVAEMKMSREDAEAALLETTRSYTKTMLSLAEDYPEMVQSLSYVGMMSFNKKEATLAFVAGDQRQPGKFVMAFSPVDVIRVSRLDPDQSELSERDYYLLAIGSGAKMPKDLEELAATSISSIVSDSDVDALIAATMIHEFGHLAGDHISARDVVPDLGGIQGIEELLFDTPETFDLTTKFGPDIIDMAEGIRAAGIDHRSSIDKAANKLAKNPVDLRKRLLRMGITPPANLEKLPLDEREKWAQKVLRASLISMIIGGIAFHIEDNDQRTIVNPVNRALGTYGLTNIEEAAAEIFLASRLGLRLVDMVDVKKDPFIEQRVNQK